MKKVIVTAVVGLSLIGLTACGQKSEEKSAVDIQTEDATVKVSEEGVDIQTDDAKVEAGADGVNINAEGASVKTGKDGISIDAGGTKINIPGY